jgi:hypothetical protein
MYNLAFFENRAKRHNIFLEFARFDNIYIRLRVLWAV